jgi:hypothetical protein
MRPPPEGSAATTPPGYQFDGGAALTTTNDEKDRRNSEVPTRERHDARRTNDGTHSSEPDEVGSVRLVNQASSGDPKRDVFAEGGPVSEPLLTDPAGEDDDTAAESSRHSSDDDEDSDDDERKAAPLTLTEIREWKLRRNQAKLAELGLGPASKQKESANSIHLPDRAGRKQKRRRMQQQLQPSLSSREGDEPHNVRRGMLLSPVSGLGLQRHSGAGSVADRDSTFQRDKIDRLYEKYPHRQMQVRTLLGLLRPAMSVESRTSETGRDIGFGSGNSSNSVPPPIFVAGPSGTGKTSVVLDVLDVLQCSEVASAYVDCAALDTPNLRAVTRTLLQQLQQHAKANAAAMTRPDQLLGKGRDVRVQHCSNADSPLGIEPRGTLGYCFSSSLGVDRQ